MKQTKLSVRHFWPHTEGYTCNSHPCIAVLTTFHHVKSPVKPPVPVAALRCVRTLVLPSLCPSAHTFLFFLLSFFRQAHHCGAFIQQAFIHGSNTIHPLSHSFQLHILLTLQTPFNFFFVSAPFLDTTHRTSVCRLKRRHSTPA